MNENLEAFWHTSSHVLAQAVRDLYPEVKLGTGPAIEAGFYYDFYRPTPFTPEDLRKIEARMAEIIAADLPVNRVELGREEAAAKLDAAGEFLKLELLGDIPGDRVTFFGNEQFMDLCAGPHISSTGPVKAFTLLSVAASYWRADEKRESMQRIYGISFPDRARLDEFLRNREEARERDHRRLGTELDLFSFQDKAGPGFVFWHPKGAQVRRVIEDFLYREHQKRGYQFLYTPHLADEQLWQTSGHLDFYRENMFPALEMDSQRLRVKPMNCPGHLLVFRNRRRSYRELPLRWAELGTVYRLEKSGVLHGLLRVRGFTQDDAHIFCRPGDLEAEVAEAIAFSVEMLGRFGFRELDIFLSTRPEKFVGTPENWEKATLALKKGLEGGGFAYRVDPGEGVFYGPKVDIKIKDVLGRSWQCSTVQVDFNMPERFDLSYQGPEGKNERPVMIHRALLGSLERFFGVLTEHYKGAFPFWLAPVQVTVLTVTERDVDYGREVLRILTNEGYRGIINDGADTIGRKVRMAEQEKVPIAAVVGGREREGRTVALRIRGREKQSIVPLDELIPILRREQENQL